MVYKESGSFNPNDDTIKLLTTHPSKGLKFPVANYVMR
jgi:ATP-dependent exoDNAse (exonuclease V) beta subunit